MKNNTNYHTHTTFCDGKAAPVDFIQSAIKKDFIALGFSAHAPAPQQESWTMPADKIPEYLKTLNLLRGTYGKSIEIYSGMEVDYIQGVQGPSSPEIVQYNLDYSLGGVHIIPIESTGKLYTIDGPEEEFEQILNLQFQGNRKALITHYFSLLRGLVRDHRPDIIAHFDLVKIRNRGETYYKEQESWYRSSVESTLDVIGGTGIILEINTGGISRGKTDSLYPSPWILKEANKRNIPITISADAHVPEAIDAMFQEAADAAYKAGYRSKRVLLGGKWQDIAL